MRVAVNVEQLAFRAPGGTARYAAELVTLLPKLFPGDSVLPFTAWHRPHQIAAAYRDFGLDGEGVPRPAVLGLPRPVLYDAWHLLGAPPPEWLAPSLAGADLVHAPMPAVPPRGKRPLVVTVHDAAFALFPGSYPRRGRRFHRLGIGAAARRADLVITVSEAAAAEIAEHTPIGVERLRVVPNGVDHTSATAQEITAALARHRLTGAPYVLWAGSLEPRKNVGTLVAAFAQLARDPNFTHQLVLAGPAGWLHEGLVDENDRIRLGDRLRTVGRVPGSELRALYAGADAFAFPSVHEGFGLPILEAMAQGTVVVCADIPSLREVAGGAARLVMPSDVGRWAEALGEVLDRSTARAALSAAGLVRASQFSWERTVRATREVYAEALGG